VKIFVDTNVLLDVLGQRQPFYSASARVWTLAETGAVKALISAISFNNVYYIVRKASGRERAEEALRLLRDVFDWVAPDHGIINQAIDSECDDFEDAVQFHSAVSSGSRFLVTRDPDGFPVTGPPILNPEEFLVMYEEQSPSKP